MGVHVPAPAAHPRAWRLNPAVQLHWRLLDDQWVVFEHAAGVTHQLDPLHAAVLMAFEAGHPLALPALLAQVCADLDRSDIDASHLALVLQQLAQRELLLPAPLHNAGHVAASTDAS